MKKILAVLLSVFCVVNMSTLLTSCKKDAHTHVFDKQVTSETYLAQEAACLEKAKYYYSCSCGEKGSETFEIGDALGHSFSEYIFDNNITCIQDGTLTATCNRCGVTDTVTLTGTKLDHKYENGACVYCGRIHLSEGLAYTLITDKLGDYYEVSGIGACAEKDISIPETYNDLPIKSIGKEAFKSCSNLKSIVISNNITSIGVEAFLDCGNLERITLPGSITSIGDGAFLNCFGLTKVNFLGTIDQWAEIDFEEGVDEGSPFSNPTQLAHDLYINDKLVTEVELTTAAKVSAYAFAFCESLINVIIENDLTAIGNGAFAFCYNLININMLETVTSIGNIAFYDCIRLDEIIIPDSVTSIGDRAFYCYNLTNIIIGNSVTYIASYAFLGCDNLTSVTFENPNGWFVTQDVSAVSGGDLTLTSPEQNATLLLTYAHFYWKRK